MPSVKRGAFLYKSAFLFAEVGFFYSLIREKLLAARRAGATDIILSSDNRRDVDDIPAAYLEGLNIRYVDTVADVVENALQ